MARTGGRQRSPDNGRSEEESDFFVRALARGLAIVALFDIEHPEWSLTDICARTGMSKTTAYRMVRTLEVKDFLEHDAKTERYHLGKAGLPGAYLLMSSVGFLRSAHPFLEELARATGETVELTVGSAEGAVVVDEVATTHPFRLNRPTGRILSNMANSSFRMHVAHRPLSEQRKIIAAPRHQWTPTTAADPTELLRRLAAEKSEGLAFDMEELDLGVCAASAPVFEHDGSVKAVLSVVAPAERFGPRERRRKSEILRVTAAKMTDYLSARSIGS
jgi:IclR family acetate operon transcriptional repressor